jgi:tetratricopeptide (TPR) repeat protein
MRALMCTQNGAGKIAGCTSGRHNICLGRPVFRAQGKYFGLGIASVLEGNTAQAADQFERAMDILPEWPGSYSTLGVFYFETGQIDKAKEVLDRFKNSNVTGGLDVNKIEQILSQAPSTAPTGNQPMTMASREQLLQLALSLADRTL